MFSFSLFGLVQPLYVAGLKMEKTQFGLLFFLSNVVSAALRLPVGWASDIYGRKWFMLAGLAFWALSGVIFPVSKTFEALIVPFLLWGTGAAFYFTTSGALIADITSPETRPKAYGTVGIYNTVGSILGPLVGGFITDAFGIEASFLLVAAAFSTSAAACVKLPNPKQNDGDRQSIAETLRGVTRASVGRMVGVFALFYFVHGIYGSVLWPILPIFYKEFYHLDPIHIGLGNTVFMVGNAIGFYMVAKLPQTLDLKKIMAYSMIPNSLLLLAYLVAGSPIALLVVVFAHGFTVSFGVFGPLGSTIFMDALPAPARGIASGITGTTWRVRMSTGSMIMGAVWASFGMIPIFYLSAAILFSEFVIILGGLPSEGRNTGS